MRSVRRAGNILRSVRFTYGMSVSMLINENNVFDFLP